MPRRKKVTTFDLGHDHAYSFLYMDDVLIGAMIEHKKPDGSDCWGGIYFDTPEARAKLADGRNYWQVQSLDPLTVSPSVLCYCGDHGFIREGRWVPA
jgi:hypothetical protein